MKPVRSIFLVPLLASATASADELPRVADCEKPVYSLDHYEGDKELMLELSVNAYKECLLHVASSHEQAGVGSSYEVRFAERALERIDLDVQAVWPRSAIIESALEHGLWTDDRSAAAVSTRDEEGNHVHVLMLQPGGNYLVVDVSPIERALVGKLGTQDASDYERLDVRPSEWLDKASDYFLLSVSLEAWQNGRRSTVIGPVLIKFDGTVVWQ